MPAYQTVVVGVHEHMTARSVQLTAMLAVETGAKLILVAAYRAPNAAATAEFQAAGVAAAEQALEKAAATCAELGHDDVEISAIAGDPASVLVSAVTKYGADLLVVGSRGLSSLGGRLLGSVPGNVAREVSCDVLIVHTTTDRWRNLVGRGHRPRPDYRRTVVVGVHDTPRSRRAAERAAAIAADHNAELVLVGAYEELDWTDLKRARDSLGAESYLVEGTFPIESALRDGAAKARAKGARDVDQVVVHGDAMKGLLKVADKRHADILVMGNHQLDGRVAQLIGSISSQVSRKTATHVLLVH